MTKTYKDRLKKAVEDLAQPDRLYSYADVVRSARADGGGEIHHPDADFAQRYNKKQKFKVVHIPLSNLSNDGETPNKPLFHEGGEEDEKWAKAMAKEYDSSDTHGPIVAHPIENSQYSIVDGRHRSRAAHLRGETHIHAFVPVSHDLDKSIESLTKGQNGDWEKEGYNTYHMFNKKDPTKFAVYAEHPDHGSVGYARFQIINDDYLIPDDDQGTDASVYVDKDHRRKGVASAMYSHAQKYTGHTIRPSHQQGDAGQALWSQPNRPFGKSQLLQKSKGRYSEVLHKARKDDLQALGEHSDWANKTLNYKENDISKPHNSHLNWLANNTRKNPASLTPEAKQSVEHFASMYHLPSVRNAKLQGMDIDTGLKTLKDAEAKDLSQQSSKHGLVTKKGQPLVNTSSNKTWYNLGVCGDEEEGKAGGHCGNMPAFKSGREHEKLLSLREPHASGKEQQHLTFVNSNGYITEAKGNRNSKPHPKYHKDIVELLEHPEIKGYVGGGYLPGSNFEPEDVTDPELKQRLNNIDKKKPGFFSPDVSDLHETVKNDPFLSHSVTDKNKHNVNNEIPLEEQHRMYHGGEQNRIQLANSPNIHPDLQMKIATSENDGRAKHILAENPNTSSSVLSYMTNSPEKYMAGKAAINPNLSPSDQMKLITGPADQYVKEQLAHNPNLHPDVQEYLYDQQNHSMNYNLSGNKNIHPDTVYSLARKYYGQGGGDGYAQGIKENLASNPHLPWDLQQKYINHNSTLRGGIAKNPQLDPELQNLLIQKNELEGQEDKANGYDEFGDTYKSYRGLAGNPNLTLDNQHKIANLPPKISHYLSKNPNLDEKLADQLEQKHMKTLQNATENDDGDDLEEVSGHIRNIRRNRLIRKFKSADEEFLRKYEHSHNDDVAKAAKKELAGRNKK